jgi:hypothetical protein
MERYYKEPSHVIHQLRMNRTRKQWDIVDTDGYRTPNKGLDDLMERLMPHMKKFPHCGTFESWIKVSKELVCCMKAKLFASFYTKLRRDIQHEQNERYNEGNEDCAGNDMADPSKTKKKTVKPGKRNASNRLLVTEILVRSTIHVFGEQQPKDDEEFVWDILQTVQQEVKGKNKHKNNPDSEQNKKTDESKCCGGSKHHCKDDDAINPDGMELDDDRDEVSVFDEQEDDDISDVLDGCELEGLDDDVDTNDDGIEAAETMATHVAATNENKREIDKVVGMTIIKFNKIATMDFMQEGAKRIKEKNLAAMREKETERSLREYHYLIENLESRLGDMENETGDGVQLADKSSMTPRLPCQTMFQRFRSGYGVS